MDEFFTNLLRLRSPFYVADVTIQKDGKTTTRVDVFIGVKANATTRKSGSVCLGIVGHEERTWQHLSIFNFPCYVSPGGVLRVRSRL